MLLVERILLSLAIAVSLALFITPVWQRVRRVRSTGQGFQVDRPGRRLGRWVAEVLFQYKTITQRPLAGLMHALVFWGFLAFIPATLDHFGRGYGFHLLGDGAVSAVISSAVAAFACLVLIGISYLAFRRFVLRPEALGPLAWESGLVALFIAILMVTYLLEFFSLVRGEAAVRINWWVHALVILAFLALIPRSKHLHLVLAPVTTFLKDFELGRIHPLDFENDEFGATQLKDLPAHTALGAFTCVKCGRCYDHCPARATGKQLDPKQLMLDLRAGFLADPERGIVEDTIQEEVLWQCTTCGACTFQCPVGIDQVVPILETRRGRAAEGEVPDTFNTTFTNLERSHNPWGYPAHEAEEFIKEQGFPVYDGHEYLYWMGCLARHDLQYRKVSLAFKEILEAARVSFGVLPGERCTGDAARRAGNEYLFQELATPNIEMLREAGVKKIVSTCPHCIRTFREYRDLGLGAVELVHHTTLIQDLLRQGRLALSGEEPRAPVVYHDPCYLSRYRQGGDIGTPRRLLRQATGQPPLEARRTRERSFCCGAGGAMIFAEETEGTRINMERTEELLETGASQVAVACPFCQVMVRDAAADLGRGEEVRVLDVAQLVAARLRQEKPAP